jgi:hypothetical protein
MKIKIILLVMLMLGIAVAAAMRQGRVDEETPRQEAQHSQHEAQQPASSTRVPAHFEDMASMGRLAPTLAPESFTGPTSEAYRKVREIPETIAQLPCYCHCDVSFGHKSLHTCFETDHASHCAICVSEALVAYDYAKKDGLSPAQIRERIVKTYSTQQ